MHFRWILMSEDCFLIFIASCWMLAFATIGSVRSSIQGTAEIVSEDRRAVKTRLSTTSLHTILMTSRPTFIAIR
jgi:hypothetical protein